MINKKTTGVTHLTRCGGRFMDLVLQSYLSDLRRVFFSDRTQFRCTIHW
jgi:hypothetical protein